MRIGLISDTHIPDPDEKIPPGVKTFFSGVDLIFHAGDLYSPSVLDDLEKLAPVKAARGDDDFFSDDDRVRDKHVLELESLSIWIVHQFNPLTWYVRGRLTMAETLVEIKRIQGLPDILVFGHSHKPLTIKLENTLFINPGSATWPDHVPKPGTVAVLTLSSGQAEVETFQL